MNDNVKQWLYRILAAILGSLVGGTVVDDHHCKKRNSQPCPPAKVCPDGKCDPCPDGKCPPVDCPDGKCLPKKVS